MYEQEKAAPGHYPAAAQSKALSTGNNYATEVVRGQPVRLPAYAKSLRPRPDRSLIVIVGQSGWSLFDRGGTTNAILLPTLDPSQFRFPDLSGWTDALIVDVDNTLTAGEEREIARALLTAGCPYVVGAFSSYKGGRAV